MRTTIDFQEPILRQLKEAMLRENVSLSHPVRMAVQEKLAQKYDQDKTEVPSLQIWDGSGLLHGVDVNDGRAL